MQLILSNYQFNETATWQRPIDYNYTPVVSDMELFDQNGYDMCPLEMKYAEANQDPGKWHRPNHVALKHNWFKDEQLSNSGPHINHALCFERKGYSGEAMAQLHAHAKTNNLIYKLIKIKPKWGLDISIDYTDADGNVFELLHWEWDGFDHDEVNEKKQYMEKILQRVDWKDAADTMLKRKEEWHHLDFFSQSEWKTKFFGVEKERFKMVLWN